MKRKLCAQAKATLSKWYAQNYVQNTAYTCFPVAFCIVQFFFSNSKIIVEMKKSTNKRKDCCVVTNNILYPLHEPWLCSTSKISIITIVSVSLSLSLFFALLRPSECVRVCRQVFYKIIFIYIELHMKSTVSFNYCNWQFIIIQSRIQCILLHCMRARMCVL